VEEEEKIVIQPLPSQRDSARQKKLDEIKEDVEGEDKEGTLERPKKMPKEITEVIESRAQKELRSLIGSLEKQLGSKQRFLPDKYKNMNTMFEHTEEEYLRVRTKILK
jgi:hypothetical protein